MKRFKELREKAKLSQRELGERIGVTEITVRKWESGDRTPTVNHLKTAAKVLGCRAADLLD